MIIEINIIEVDVHDFSGSSEGVFEGSQAAGSRCWGTVTKGGFARTQNDVEGIIYM